MFKCPCLRCSIITIIIIIIIIIINNKCYHL